MYLFTLDAHDNLEQDSDAENHHSLILKHLSWNVEELKRNFYNLRHFCDQFKPNLLFLSEAQIFHCDLPLVSPYFNGLYSIHLNSDETDQEGLAMVSNKSHGGTVIMISKNLEPYAQMLPSSSSSFTAVLVHVPNFEKSVHIALYMPTAGKDSEFLTVLSCLNSFIRDTRSKFQCSIHIRGDSNCNPKNEYQCSLFRNFCQSHDLLSVDFEHSSYHHFTGNGASDSQLDMLLYSNSSEEILTHIQCSLSNLLVYSSHDLIVSSSVHSSCSEPTAVSNSENISAIRLPNHRKKIVWNEDNIPYHNSLIGDNLQRLRDTWMTPNSPSCVAMLLESTYSVLSTAAEASNKVIDLGMKRAGKPRHNPQLKKCKLLLSKASKEHKLLTSMSTDVSSESILHARSNLVTAIAAYRQAAHSAISDECTQRDAFLHSALSSNPCILFQSLRSFKSHDSAGIQSLKVGDKVYCGSEVPDGFFDSLSSLKAPSMTHSPSDAFKSTVKDFDVIVKICQSGLRIPQISARDATEILYSVRTDVNDFYSITARHFINAGVEGALHFHYLMNAVIDNTNNFSLPELNSVWANVLYKGHGKPPDLDRSYRTISTCPLLSKCLDKYVGSLYESGWASAQAETQFQGPGSSHDLAAVLLTEAIQYSIYVAKAPLFVLMLDAKSAFDKIRKESIIRNAF